MSNKIKYGFPAFLSMLWPGLGQLVKGEVSTGITYMVGYFFSLLLCTIYIGFITTPILWILCIHDAYNKEIN